MSQDQQQPILMVIDQLVETFIDTYEPEANEYEAEEVFTMGKLRSFFCAYDPKPGFVDPIGEYLRILSEHGFRLNVTMDGHPAIFVNRRKG